ncbi:ABC transporter substrate-binding protein [Allosalinactinospora lopnorensis]|uniref:ABC transporter substrate-binding protein n=1 Tax=Allosalinactinospora lopnorensis TaxID=1352348 RepID=UPI000623E00C|nr:ABC transporter substrate-binding protein [Allosalinactinospora lopnorensis]
MQLVRSFPAEVLGAAAALGLLTTGCFSGGDGGDDGRLDMALAFPPVKQMSPYSDDAALLGRVGAAEPLITLDDDGAPRPLLAEDWEQADDDTWELTLRDDVTFQNGTEMTAEHVADALGCATEASPLPRALAGTELTAEADGRHALTIDTGNPDPVLPQRLSSPELAILAPEAYEEDPGTPDPKGTGTGPFELSEVDGGTATLEAYDGYWSGEPQATGIDVRFVEDSASRVGALRAGEADIVDAVPVAELENITEQNLVEVQLPRTVGMFLNNDEGVFTDPELRAAAAAAVDSDPIVEGIYEGRADPVEGIYGPVSDWSEDRPDVDPEAEPGDPDGAGITLATYSDRAELPEAASAVAEDLREAGFEVDIAVQEFATMETDLMEGEFDAVIGTRSYLLETNDPIAYLASDWGCDGSYNLARFCDAEVDERIAEAAGETDVEQRLRAAVEIEADILATHSFVPLAAERARIGVAEDVEGVAEDPLERTIVTAGTRTS